MTLILSNGKTATIGSPLADTLRRLMRERDLTVESLAAQSGLPEDDVNGVLLGIRITDEIAEGFTRVFDGITSEFWLRRQAGWDEYLQSTASGHRHDWIWEVPGDCYVCSICGARD